MKFAELKRYPFTTIGYPRNITDFKKYLEDSLKVNNREKFEAALKDNGGVEKIVSTLRLYNKAVKAWKGTKYMSWDIYIDDGVLWVPENWDKIYLRAMRLLSHYEARFRKHPANQEF